MRTPNYTADIVVQLQDACDFQTEPRELERLCGNALAEIKKLRAERPAAIADLLDAGTVCNLMQQRDEAIQELKNIEKADYRKWDAEVATAEDFVRWAKSRARFTIDKVEGVIQDPLAWSKAHGVEEF